MSNTAPAVRRSYVDGLFGQVHLRMAAPAVPAARPLLCFHLSPISGVVFESILRELGRDRIAVAPDTPGYGMSDAPQSQPDIATYAQAMTDLIDTMGFQEVDLLGYCTGSTIAFDMALQQPQRVRSLFLMCAPDYTEEEVEFMRNFLGVVIEPVEDGSHLLQLWQQVKGYPTNEGRMKVFPDHIRGSKREPWGPLAAFSYRYRDRMDELQQPMFILNVQSEITEPTRRLSPLLPEERYLERLDWTHGFEDLHAADVADLVRTFTANV